MLAGPNGAGKTTFYTAFLQDKGLPFINADRIAAELSLDAYEAAEYANCLRANFLARKESFISETVFSDPVGQKVMFLQDAVKQGYAVTLFYIGIASADLSAKRVATRVRAGGHDVPVEKLAKRYQRSLRNLEKAAAILPRVILYDNSDFIEPYKVVAEFRSGKVFRKTNGKIPDWAHSLYLLMGS
jgi:predicted ABC-type ATPase